MFSNAHNPVREKKFTLPRQISDGTSKRGFRTTDATTITDSGLLYLAQQARIAASLKRPVSGIRRMFRWWGS